MDIVINQNKDGISEFIKVFKSNSIIEKSKIEELFNTNSYEKLVKLFGNNIGLTEKKQWIDLFYEAYSLNLKSHCYTGNDVIKKNMIMPIIWAIKNIDELDNYTNKVINVINKKEYLKKAMEYLPEINCDIRININYYIFMYNACVEENEILMDIGFANQFSDTQLNDLLAHEMHHYLKDYGNISEEPKKECNDVTRALFALENEGTADMCSFDSLSYIYEHFGYMEKGKLNKVLGNITNYIEQLNYKLEDKLINNNESVSIYSFIMSDEIVHPLGYTMATQIKNFLGIKELIQCTGKPLQFLIKFNIAFEKSTGKKAFSDDIINKLCIIYNR